MNQLISKLRTELYHNIDNAYKQSNYRFFKEKIKQYGIRTPIVRKIARVYFAKIKHLEKRQVFNLCEELLKSGYNEEATIAFQWIYALRNKFQLQDFKIFESWLMKYVDNWGKCDDFCVHTIGCYIEKYPHVINIIKKWTISKNRWLRRASAVSLISIGRKGWNLDDIFDIANRLLTDKDDLVQKGYGWMLKEASTKHQMQVFNYIMKNKSKMPRPALRYAIELMPENLKRKAMAK